MSVAPGPVLHTLATFATASDPFGGVILDPAGDLFGTTASGGSAGGGTVFEIPRTDSGFEGVQTLAAFTGGTDGGSPFGPLASNANGDLFGMTRYGGTFNDGTVFEIARLGSGYGPLQTLGSFNGSGNGNQPTTGLLSDRDGNLFGTTLFGGSSDEGTVFEIARSGTGYGPIQTLASFTGGRNGDVPEGCLIADAKGDLFGSTSQGGHGRGYGTVFEIPKAGSSYGPIVTLAAFSGWPSGSQPSGLVADADGNLFGVTSYGGKGNDNGGTLFEIAKTAHGYGPLQILALFGRSVGMVPDASLIVDAVGNLFGTAFTAGSGKTGTVFEVPKAGSGYGPIRVITAFDGTNGSFPGAVLSVDAAGNMYGTTEGSNQLPGTVFEITNSGYQVSATDTWKGPGGTADAPASGSFLHGANWSSGAVPGTTSDAVLGSGAYTINARGGSVEVHSLSIGSGARLQVLDNGNFAATSNLAIDGTLEVGGGTLSGDVGVGSGGLLTGFGTVASSITEASGSSVRALGGTLALTGTNVFSGALTGVGTLQFAEGTDLLASGAMLTAKTTLVSGATVMLGEELTDFSDFGLQGGTVDLNGHALTLEGDTALSGGVIEGGGTSVLRFIGTQHLLTSSGATTIAPTVLNSGSIAITGGTLHLEGNLFGAGRVVFSATGSASLEIGGTTAGGQTIDVDGNTAVSLIFDRASTFKGSLANLAAGDTIDLTNVASKSTMLSFDSAANTLDVNLGGRTVAALKFAGGSYGASQFSLTADAHAGSVLTFHGMSA